MNIRRLVSIVFYTLSGMLVLQSCSLKKEQSDKPNIIYILADDLGYGDVSFLNPESKIQTPQMDKLAEASMVFTDAHTNAAVCTPTRYGILTGRYNWRSWLKQWALGGYEKAVIKPDRSTVADFLKTQGYATACIGKWHLGWEWANIEAGKEQVDFSKPITNGPTDCGFDYFYGFCASLDIPPYVWIENDLPTQVPTKRTIGNRNRKYSWWRDGLCADDFKHEDVLPEITHRAQKYINKNAKGDKPFFLYFPLPAPHTPILPSKEFQGKSGLDSPYADFVLMVDWVVGEISKTLKEKGIEENTLIVFTSDNGCSPEANYEHLAKHDHNPSHVFRGTKADIFEGGHRVPFFVSWPARIQHGSSKHLVSTTDFYATLADLFQTELKDNEAEDSFSMLKALGIKSDKVQRESMVQHSGHGKFALRKGEWKACFCTGSGGWSYPTPKQVEKLEPPLPEVQLYNLKNDVAEKDNKSAEFPEIAKAFRAELKEIIENGRSTEGTVQKNDAPESWPQMEAIINN